jgi:hypothetical protein
MEKLQEAKKEAVRVSWEAQYPYDDVAETVVFVLSIALAEAGDGEAYNFARRVAWRAEAVASGDEGSWQVRHFVHAMECIQAGKKWPDITETP